MTKGANRVSTAKTEISLAAVDAAYAGRTVLNNIDMQVNAGEMVGIIGPNGSGKSTLLKTMGRLIKPTSGTVFLNGKNLASIPTRSVARRLALIPQIPSSPQELTVRELVGYGRYPHVSWLKRFGIRDRHVVQKTLQSCQLEEISERSLNTLSGGERQRAWIALAMAQQPRLMLLDEPVTFLDLSHQLEIMDLVADQNKSEGTTVVTVLHDLNLAALYCERLIALRAGRIYVDGPTHEVMNAGVLRDVFGIAAHIGGDPITKRPVCYPYRMGSIP